MKRKVFWAGGFLLSMLHGCGGEGPNPMPVSRSLEPTRTAAQIQTVTINTSEMFFGKYASYTITKSATGYTVINILGGEQTRTISSNVKKLQFADVSVALDLDGNAAQVYRLYQAAFDRLPDSGGIGFHIAAIEAAGFALAQVSDGFIRSAEFTAKYGNVSNSQFVSLLYGNVLHRAGEPAGLAFWSDLLDRNALSRAQVLTGFSESPENKTAVNQRIENGVMYTPFTVAGTGSASTSAAAGAKVAWGVSNNLLITLRDAGGTEVPGGHITCTAADERILTISPDCRTATGKRLGDQVVTVKGDGVSATIGLKVIPQRQPIAANGTSEHYNLVVTGAGNVLGWGRNNNGVLGQGVSSTALSESSLPIMVKNAAGTGNLSNIVSASAGELNGLALTEDGEVMFWGSSSTFGFSSKNPYLPGFVPNPANNGNLKNIAQVAIGDINAAALADDGTVLTWGWAAGQGSADSIRFPNQAKDPSGNGILTGIVSISAGWNFTLALGADGKVYGWGRNSVGQTGRGTATGSNEPLPATVRLASDNSELSNIVAISAGYDFSLALSRDGKVYAWGDNGHGQLGQNVQHGLHPRAELVKDPSGNGILSDIVMVSAGAGHGLALDATGRVYSWGLATSGQLGDGANRPVFNQALKPILVVGPGSTGQLSGTVSIAAGGNHSLAVASDGTVYIWGQGFGSALGQGGTSASDNAVPTTVKFPSSSTALSLSPLAAYPNLLRRGF